MHEHDRLIQSLSRRMIQPIVKQPQLIWRNVAQCNVRSILCFMVLGSTAFLTVPSVAQEPPVAAAMELYPLDVAVQKNGTAFVVDRNMHGVWQWHADKLSVFFEGSPKYRTPLNAARCIALDNDGVVLVGDTATRDIYRVSEGGKAEPITGGKIGIPMDIAVASDGTIYVADLETRALVKIPAGTDEVESVADVNPRGVFVDQSDSVWVVSQDPEQLQVVAADGTTQAIVKERTFEFPHQVVVNSAGDAFVTDGYAAAIWKVAKGAAPAIVFQGAPLENPVGITLVRDADGQEKIYVVDPRARKVFELDADGKPSQWFELKR